MNEIDAKEVFAGKSGGDTKGMPPPEQPSEEEFQESFSPELSSDEFVLGDKTFQIRISNIRTQKLMAKSMDAITDLIKKIDLKPIFDSFQEKLNKDRKKLVDRIANMKKESSKSESDEIDYDRVVRDMTEEDDTGYIDMIEIAKEVIVTAGLSNIIAMILDLYSGIIFAICNGQQKDVTKKWIEENLTFFEAQDIFFRQMEKDKIGGKVIDFLYVLTRQLVKE